MTGAYLQSESLWREFRETARLTVSQANRHDLEAKNVEVWCAPIRPMWPDLRGSRAACYTGTATPAARRNFGSSALLKTTFEA
jgi:hypothetical protein